MFVERHEQRAPLARAALQVRDLHAFGDRHPQSKATHATTQIEVFRMQAVAFIEASHLHEHSARQQHQRTRGRIDIQHRLRGVRRQMQRVGGTQRMPECAHEGRIATPRGCFGLSLRIAHVGTEQADVRGRREDREHPRKRIERDETIRIDEGEHRATGFASALVAGHREARVVRIAQQPQARVGPQRGDRAIRRSIVDHQHFAHAGSRQQAAHAFAEHRTTVVRDHDRRQLRAHRERLRHRAGAGPARERAATQPATHRAQPRSDPARARSGRRTTAACRATRATRRGAVRHRRSTHAR